MSSRNGCRNSPRECETFLYPRPCGWRVSVCAPDSRIGGFTFLSDGGASVVQILSLQK